MNQTLLPRSLKERVAAWVKKSANGPHAVRVLVLTSFAESSFFPLPPDFLLMAMLLAGARRWVYYSTLTTIASVAGGIAGYAMGLLFFDTVGEAIVSAYHLEEDLLTVQTWYQEHAFLAVFIAGFTPIPYKLFTIAAGLFKINFPIFVIASIISRGARFFLVGFLLSRYGARIGDVLYRYVNIFSFVVAAVLVILYLLLR